MRHHCWLTLLVATCCSLPAGLAISVSDAAEADAVKQRADQAFGRLAAPAATPPATSSGNQSAIKPASTAHYSPETHWIGHGQGDLAKGPIVCQRVSELSARTDLAKQIRVMVKEHMVDRVRDRIGREPEQDIELTREEIVQEYLQDVTIVERRIDEDTKTCHATAVMPRTLTSSKPAPSSDPTAPAPSR